MTHDVQLLQKLRHLVRISVVLSCVLASWPVQAANVTVSVHDAATGERLAARAYLRDEAGKWYYFTSDSRDGSAVRYEKQNWINRESVEYHTTLSAHNASVEVPAGKYQLTVERGKEYFPEVRQLEVGADNVTAMIELRRWINMAERGWYSGETHLHRTLQDLANVVVAEDLNVAFPLTYWVTRAYAPPAAGDKNQQGAIPSELIRVDDRHVIWPRNTEYEIFSVDGKRHTLGALFVLKHVSVLDTGVPPWGPVVEKARKEGALFDLDKLDWPVSMVLPPLARESLYELANNHMWRTNFAFSKWNSRTDGYLQPPAGAMTGNEREWVNYTLGMYYSLLNCGLRMPPTAGTANGVHPVPAGFSRVYAHLPDGFSFDRWVDELRAGRTFITTGPMLFAKAQGQLPGTQPLKSEGAVRVPINVEIVSQQPLSFCEVVANGVPLRTYMGRNKERPEGGFVFAFEDELEFSASTWFIIRAWEERGEGRFRFAHSAPWYVEIDGQPIRPRAEDRDYLVRRVREEMARSQGVVSPEAMAEYDAALKFYSSLPLAPDRADVRSQTRRVTEDNPSELDYWLNNMRLHQYTLGEMSLVTGLSEDRIAASLERLAKSHPASAAASGDRIRVEPFPGGRHPRSGFLDGAMAPQRETKISVFPPWPDGGYIVVDVPEAVFSNLGLTYLAHTHVPTLWTKQGIELPRLEWQRAEGGAFSLVRELPNGIVLRSLVRSVSAREVAMELELTNGTPEKLTGLRVQTCVMLKGANGFQDQTNSNKVLRPPLAAAHTPDKSRWIITGWTPNHRAWANPPCPCLHSDPHFPDCQPGETVRVQGRLWCYEGTDIEAELQRLEEQIAAGASK